MFVRCLFVVGLVVSLTGCPDHKPQISESETTSLIEAWFRDEGAPDGTNAFEKGQEKSVKVEKAYSHGISTESYAEIGLTGFRIQTYHGPSTFNGRALVRLRKNATGNWEVRSMSLLDGDHVKETFHDKEHLPVGEPVSSPAQSATPIASATPPASAAPTASITKPAN